MGESPWFSAIENRVQLPSGLPHPGSQVGLRRRSAKPKIVGSTPTLDSTAVSPNRLRYSPHKRGYAGSSPATATRSRDGVTASTSVSKTDDLGTLREALRLQILVSAFCCRCLQQKFVCAVSPCAAWAFGGVGKLVKPHGFQLCVCGFNSRRHCQGAASMGAGKGL